MLRRINIERIGHRMGISIRPRRRHSVQFVSSIIESVEPRRVLTPTITMATSTVTVPEDITAGLDVSDPDPEIAAATVTNAFAVDITDGDPNGHFAVDFDGASTAIVRVDKDVPLDYESQSSFILTLTATGGMGESAETTLTVNVTDVAETQADYDMEIMVDLDGDGITDSINDEELFLGSNDDDDNANGTADLSDAYPDTGADDDLVLVTILISGTQPLNNLYLTADGQGLRVWADESKSQEITFNSALEIPDSASQEGSVDVYVEGLSSTGQATVAFTLNTPDEFVEDGLISVITKEIAFKLLNPKGYAWTQKLREEQKKHVGYIYYEYEPSGFKSFFDKLLNETFKVSFSTGPPAGAEAAYKHVWDTIYVDDISAIQTRTAIHETVHALDDHSEWYLEGYVTDEEEEKAEALAYGAEAIVIDNTVGLRRFEDRIKDGTINQSNVLQNWKLLVIDELNGILNKEIWTPADPNNPLRTVTADDLKDIKEKLGLNLDMSFLMSQYQALLDQHGINVTLTMDPPGSSLKYPFRNYGP